MNKKKKNNSYHIIEEMIDIRTRRTLGTVEEIVGEDEAKKENG